MSEGADKKKKKAFVLRLNLEMMQAVEQWAHEEFRSVNGQIEWMISECLKKSGRKKK
jgi:hypothetical protein